MKKTMQLLIIISLMFIGINEVRGAIIGINRVSGVSGNTTNETVLGTCELQNSAQGDCTYSCRFKRDSDYLKLEYHINLLNGKLTGEITKHEVSENSVVFGSNVTELPKFPLFMTIFNSYTVELGQNIPVADLYDQSDNFSCPTVTPKDNITMTTGLDSTGLSYIRNIENQIIFSVDRSSNSNVMPSDTSDNAYATCGLLGDENSKMVKILRDTYGYIKIIIPVLVIVLGIADFVKVVTSGKDDDMKKAIDKFAKRIIIAIVFILIPIIVKLLINISGLNNQYSGIDDGIKAMLCILK